MSLTRSQKNYIEKHNSTDSKKIADVLRVTEADVHEYRQSKSSPTEKSEEKNRQTFMSPYSFGVISFLKQNYLYLLLLAFAIIVTYANAINNAFVSDDVGIVKNVQNFNFISEQAIIFFRPLLNFLAYEIWGLQPFAFRLINIFFHIGTVWIIYLFFRTFTNFFIAVTTALIFAVHPVMVESITWISGGVYEQYTFFILFSLFLYILAQKKKNYIFYSIILYVLALVSSEKAIIFPFILSLYEFSFESIKRNWKRLLPFFAVSGMYTLLYFSRLSARAMILHSSFAPTEKGYDNPFFQIPVAITSYLQLLFWPSGLTIYHSELSYSLVEFIIRAVLFVLFIACVVVAYKKERMIFFWLMFFMISLLPMLTPFRITWIVAERYVYLGSVGVIATVAILLSKLKLSEINKKILYIVIGCIVIAFSLASVARNSDWENEDSLWIATGKTSPSSPNNHNNLGDVYGRRGDKQKAIEEFKKAIAIKPNYADAYHNLANTYQEVGNTQDAIDNYKKAIQFNPDLWQSYYNLSAIYYMQGQYMQAKNYGEKALQLNPDDPNMYINLAAIYIKLGDKEKARQNLMIVLQADPNNANAKTLLQQIQ